MANKCKRHIRAWYKGQMPILGRNKEVGESSVELKLVAKFVVGSLLLQIVQSTPYINWRRQIRSRRVYDRQRWLKCLFDSSDTHVIRTAQHISVRLPLHVFLHVLDKGSSSFRVKWHGLQAFIG
mgnify:FL=1